MGIKIKGLIAYLESGEPVTLTGQRGDYYYSGPVGLRLSHHHHKDTVTFAPMQLPRLEDIDCSDPDAPQQPLDQIVLLAAGFGFDILKPEVVLTWSLDQLEKVLRWMCFVHASAGDHVVRKKNLLIPEFAEGVIK